MSEKQAVHDFWNAASCGEALYLRGSDADAFSAQAVKRYELEPYILAFAAFESSRGRDVLEIGVGLGADHQRFAAAGARLCGIDLTERAVVHTRNRLATFGLRSSTDVGDAENLRFADESFDVVYSWGVLHHSPDTQRAIEEVWRVLRPGGTARVMIYHKYSIVGYLLWVRYALLSGHPWRTLGDIYGRYLESPGTKAYSLREAKHLFRRFTDVHLSVELSHGDLLSAQAGQRHRGLLLTMARAVWPRKLVQRLMRGHGLFLLVSATK